MAYASVQNSTAGDNSVVGNAVTTSFAAGVTAGNTVVGIAVLKSNGVTGLTVVDNNSVSVSAQLVAHDTLSTFDWLGVFWATRVTGTPTSYTVTAIGGGANLDMQAYAEEYSGFSAGAGLDAGPTGANVASSTGANSMSSGNITTTKNGDFIWSCGYDFSGAGVALTAGTVPAYTLNANNAGALHMFTEWLTQASAGSIAGTWQAAATGDTCGIAVLSLTQAGASSRLRTLMGVGQSIVPVADALYGSAAIWAASKLAKNPVVSRRSLIRWGRPQ